MSHVLKKIIRIVTIVLALVVVAVSGLLAFLMLTEFTPARHLTPEIKGNGQKFNPSQREFSFLTWNIGYAGLGREQDFFYDGGRTVNPDPQKVTQYYKGIKQFLEANDTADFIFLQETDLHSKRSAYMDEIAGIAALLPGFSMIFAKNYDCRFVPVPVNDPMGRVVSGIATFSKFQPQQAGVQYFDAYFPWPKRIVFLKRCFILTRFSLDNGKDLVIINTHNSAFDPSGMLRKIELATLDSAAQSEYRLGNYVVTGGDWNSNPRGFDVPTLVSGDLTFRVEPPIDTAFFPGWPFAFDPSRPSNRNVDMPYRKGVTKTTIIDFFVVSPNVEIIHVAAVPMGFAYSDHEPVKMKIRLK